MLYLNLIREGEDITREEYVKMKRDRVPAWGFVTSEGVWYEKGEIVSILKSGLTYCAEIASDYDFTEAFWEFVTGLGPDDGLYVLDCHV